MAVNKSKFKFYLNEGLTPNLAQALADISSAKAPGNGAYVSAYMPQAYGAKGDGVADDTAAVQTACTAAAPSYGIVYLQPGSYLVTSTINVPTGVSIVGAGRRASRFKGSAIVDAPVIAGAGNNYAAAFRDFGIDGRPASQSNFVTNDGAAYGLNKQYGLWVGQYATHCLIENVDVDGCAVGMGLGYGGVTFFNCHAQNARVAGLWIAGNNADTHRVIGGLFQVTNPSGSAVSAELPANIKITDDGAGHLPQNVLIDGCTIDEIGLSNSAGGASIYIQGIDVTLAHSLVFAPGKKQAGGGDYIGVHIASTAQRVTLKKVRVQPYVVDTQRVPTQTVQVDAGATGVILEDVSTDPNAANGGGDILDNGTGTAWRNVNGTTKDPAYATGSRPAASASGTGARIYDSTLHKPVWSDGTNWRDASGTVV